ncbi:MAG: tetratricopeptide repeat protein [Rhodospirillales bacterium]
MTDTAAADFEHAAALHARGDLDGAARAFRALLDGAGPPEPAVKAEALRHLGLIHLETQKLDSALESMRAAVECGGQTARCCFDLGRVYMALQHHEDALEAFDQAQAAGLNEPALQAWRAEALNGLERYEPAEDAAQAALAEDSHLSRAHMALGVSRLERGDAKGAHAPLNRALLYDPESAAANFHRARLAGVLNDLSGAAGYYTRALEADENFIEALNNLGNVSRQQGRLHEAEALFKRAVRIAPHVAAVHMNHGVVLQELGDDDDAARAYDRALECEPNLAEARRNRALLLLKKGNLAEGFKEYEWRWRTRTFQAVKPPADAPLWDGRPLDGVLAFWSEQGVGDAIQFIRYAPFLKERMGEKGRLTAVAPESLHKLFESAPGVDAVTSPENPPEGVVAHLPMLSAPHLVGTTIHDIPADCPYLAPSAEEREKWRGLADKNEFNVGVVWSGDTRHANDRRRSMSSEDMLPLLGAPGVRVYIFQVGPAADEGGSLIREGAIRVGHRFKNFDSTAAAIDEMDLMISVDTAVAHLAGAMNKPVWLALSAVQDWRWFEFLEDSPWYPSARLHRQNIRGSWTQVINDIAADLNDLAAKKG